MYLFPYKSDVAQIFLPDEGFHPISLTDELNS